MGHGGCEQQGSNKKGGDAVRDADDATYDGWKCFVCEHTGALIVDKDHSGQLAIERCDECGRFKSDNDAVLFVWGGFIEHMKEMRP